MPCQFLALCFSADDPHGLARFWADLLNRQLTDDHQDGPALLPNDETEFRIRFLAGREHSDGPNQLHFHLTSTSVEDQQRTVATALGAGARHLDVGQRPEEGHIVLADPEGNEFCVIAPGNTFLAGCGFLGELSCDGLRDVGYFWSKALGWPLVWDQDQETAIRSPRGGPKISWGGPTVRVKTGRNRLHFDIAPPADGDQQAEVDRLVALGATRADGGQGEVGHVAMTDPGGNEFCVLTPR